jgi:hypothetical protein
VNNIHTETIIRQFPMLALCAMENGGMVFTEDGEYLDAADQPMDPKRIWLDFENGDGKKGHIPLSLEDSDEDLEAILDDPETEEEELSRLQAEQAEDDATTRYIETRSENDVFVEGYGFDHVESVTQIDDRNSCNSDSPGHRTNGKGGWITRNRGKKPEYKDRRLRAAGSSKTRARDTTF